LVAHFLEGEVEPVAHLIAHHPAYANPAGLSQRFSRAVTFTPSPKMSSPSAITSPSLMPMRNSLKR
jgi:hypothetical protein